MKKHTYFLDKSRKKKKQAYIEIKNKIMRMHQGRGLLFYTHDYIGQGTQWADIYFLSRNKKLFYNVTIETANAKWHAALENYCSAKTDELLTPEEQRRGMDILMDSFKSGFIEFAPFETLGGKTTHEYACEMEEEKSVQQEIFVHECYELDYEYAYGVGLTMVVNEAFLDEAAIQRAIVKFWDQGEHDWTNPVALQFEYAPNFAFHSNPIHLEDNYHEGADDA